MVPENEFHHKDPPARSVIPAQVQNGPGTVSQSVSLMVNAVKPEESSADDAGE